MDLKVVYVAVIVFLAVIILPSANSTPLQSPSDAQRYPRASDSKQGLGNMLVRYMGRKFGLEKQARFLSGYCDLNSYLTSRTTASIAFIPLCAFLFSPFLDSINTIVQP